MGGSTMKRRRFLKATGAASAAGFSGYLGQQDDGELEETSVNALITFIPDMHYAPIMGAAEFGYFEDVGLDVTVESGGGQNPLQVLTSDKYDAIVAGPTEQITGRARGIPINTLLTRTGKTPSSYLTLGDSPTSVQDFPGNVLGRPNEPDIKAYNEHILNQELSESQREKVKQVFVGFAMSNLLTGKIDIHTVFETNADVTSLKVVEDIDLNVIPHSNFINAPGNVCLTTESFASNNPNTAREFTRAYCRSLIETLKPENMDKFVEMTIKNLEEADANVYLEGADPQIVQETIYKRFLELRPIPEWKENGAGWNNPEDFASVQEMLANIGVVSEAAKLSSEELVQNQFINEIYDDQGRLKWQGERIEVPI